MNFYKKGAEAELIETTFDGKKALLKKRVPKSYRNKQLDELIIKKRTRAEAKLIKQAALVVQTPQIYEVNDHKGELLMEYISGDQLKDIIKKEKKLCVLAGKQIRKLHDAEIIHGDLTTSNILVRLSKPKKTKELVFIDFGLGYFSKKLEDKATDLIVFKKTFNATHPLVKNGWLLVMKGYNASEEMIEQMNKIEKRARYH